MNTTLRDISVYTLKFTARPNTDGTGKTVPVHLTYKFPFYQEGAFASRGGTFKQVPM